MSKLTIDEFADQMDEIMPVVGREFLRRHLGDLCKGKITVQQLLIADTLCREGEIRMGDLARIMAVTTAAMTGMVERLVRYGYVERVSNPDDRRIIKVRLTRAGEDFIATLNARRRKAHIKIFGQISPQDREDYLRILTQIKNVLLNSGEE